MTARVDYSDYRTTQFTCSSCGWSGPGKDTCQNAGALVMDLECPSCFKMLAILNFPRQQSELKRDSEAQRQAKLQEINFRERFKRMSLKSPDELPHLPDDNLVFHFRSDTIKGVDYNIIELDGKEIWKEPMVWEGYERFMEIGRILKAKYGEKIKDLVPNETAETFLYGDKIEAPALIAAFRKELQK